MKIFRPLFSGTVRPRRLKLVTHVENGWMYCVYRNQASALIPFIFSFFFLSNFQTLKSFVTLFSGTVRPRRLKLVTHVDSGQMYSVYRYQAAAYMYLSHYFFIFLSLQFSNIEIFCQFFAWESGCCCLFILLFFIFLSILKQNFLSHFSREL